MSRPLRSLLFIPGDSERKITRGLSTQADAIILDLEDSVTPDRKEMSRSLVSETLKSNPALQEKLWVRINPLTSRHSLHDLSEVMTGRPAGILLPKSVGPQDVIRLSHYLDALETRDGIRLGATEILAVTTETAQAPFNLGRYAETSLPRLAGLTWGAEDLSSALGAAGNKDDSGHWTHTYKTVRSLCLMAAKACGVQAVETLFVDFRDPGALLASCRRSRREGFTGRFAIHPDQVDPINEGYMPDAADVERAERIVAAFANSPDAGTIGLDGEMLDLPHLEQAEKTLSLHQMFAASQPA